MRKLLRSRFALASPSCRTSSPLLKLLAVLGLLLASNSAWAQLSGIKTIGVDYPTVAAAITALNAGGVGTGGVTFNVPANYTETFSSATAGQITLNNTSANPASAANPVVFQKSGTGANPVLTSAGGGGTTDAVLSVVGTDYVTFNGLDVRDSGAAVEFGYALFRVSATDGSQNVTIRNSVVTLNKTNTNTIGIAGLPTGADGTAYTASTTGGANSGNKVYGSVVTNSLIGVNFAASSSASTANYDQNNEIGSTATGTGNTIGNFGGTASGWGAGGSYQNGLRIINNTANSTLNYTSATSSTAVAASTVTSTLRGIFGNSGTSSNLDITGNTVTLASGATTSQMSGIENSIGSTAAGNTVNITNNTVTNCTYATATSASVYYLYNSASPATLNITGNTITNNTSSATGSGLMYQVYNTGAAGAVTISTNTLANNALTGTGAYAFIYNSATATASITMAGNTMSNTAGTADASTGNTYFIYNNHSTPTVTVQNNQVTAFFRTAASGTNTVYGYFNNGAGTGTQTLSGNTFNNVSLSSSSNFYGIYSTTSVSENEQVSGNTISNVSSTSASILYGIYCTLGTAASQFYNNTITGLSTTATVYGLNLTLTQATAYGNVIGNLSSSGTSVSVYGLYSTSTTQTFYRNKVYGLSSTGTSGTVYGLYTSGATTATLYNNLLGSFTATASTSTNAVVGLYIASGTTVNAYYNTIYLNATGGATFGTSGIYLGSTTTTLDARNNLVANLSTAAGTGGYTAALRRVSGTAGTVPANYATTSNNNLYYAGTPSATNLIYVEGTATATNAQQTLATYKTFMANRDQQAVTENPPFASTTGTAANFLHLTPGASTYAESNAQALGSIAIDYDNDPRGPYSGATMPYTVGGVAQANGGGVAPDIGADEGDFAPRDLVTVSNTQYSQTTATIGQGTAAQLAATLIVTATGTTPSPKLTSLTVSATNPADIAAVTLYTSTSATFSLATATLVPSTNNLSGTSPFTITATNGSAPTTGTTYYFVVYDIATTAGTGDQITSAITSTTIGGTAYTPTLSGAAGTLTVIDALAGTYYIDANNTRASTRNFLSFTAAVNALNTQGVKANVIFDVAPGQTFLEGGTLVPVITTTGLSTRTITFERDPDTGTFAASLANPVLQPTGTAAANEAALALAGGDYFTFSNLTIGQPAASTALEYGIALFRASAVNGAQNNTVQNCAITLSTTNTASVGIYGATTTSAGVAVVPTSTAGANSNNIIVGNTITNAVSGIQLVGYNNASYYDTNNSVGGVAGATTGNTVTGFGVAAATAYGVFTSYQSGALLNNNTVTGSASTAAIYGIYQDASTATSVAMSNNTATLTQGGNFASFGVYNNAAGAAGTTMTLSNNTVSLTLTAASPTTTATTYGVYNAATATSTTSTITLSGNNVVLAQSGFTGATTTAVLAGVYNAVAAGSLTLSTNNVKGTITNTTANSGNGNMYGVYNTGAANSATGALVMNSNVLLMTLSSSAGGGFGASGFYGVYNTGAAANTASLSSNSFAYNVTLGGSAGFGSGTFGVYNAGTVANTLAMNLNAPITTTVAVNVTANGYNSSGFYGVYNTAAVTNGISLSQNQVSVVPTSGTVGQAAQNQGYNPSDFAVYNTGAVSAATGTISLNANTVSFTPTLNSTGNNNAGSPSYGVGNTGSVNSTATTGTPALSLTGNAVTIAATFNSTGNVGPASGTGSNLFGVFNSGGVSSTTGTLAMTTNTVSVTATSATANSTGTLNRPVLGVYNSGTIAGTGAVAASLTGNTVNGNSTFTGTGTVAPTPLGTLTGVSNVSSIAGGALLSNNNLFTSGTSYPTTGATTLLNNSGTVAGPLSISNNLIGPASGTATFKWTATSYLISNTAAGSPVSVSSNTLRNVSSTGTGAGVGINVTAGTTGSVINGNTIVAFAGGGALTGISVAPAAVTVSTNKLTDLSGTAAASVVTGVAVTGGTATVQNNLVGNLTAPAATSGAAIAGLLVSGGTAVNLYNNTVYLAGSGGTNFGTAGIYLSSNTPTVTLLNNLVSNTSTANGTGFAAALRRTTAAPTGYATASNYNLYYSATGPLYYDGTTPYLTLPAFQAVVAPRETRSQTENVTFSSTTGTDPTFLHINPTTPTLVESSGVVIASVTTDYDGDARGPYAGNVPPYTVNGITQTRGGGAAPDLGADEGDFTPQPITVTSLTYDRRNATVGLNTTNQNILGFTVVMGIGSPTQKLGSVGVSLLLTGGATAADFSNARLYQSPTSTFDINTATLVPTTGTIANNYTLTATTAPQLYSGSNYFFLVYDIGSTAPGSSQVSSTITAATIGGTVYNAGTTPPVASSGSTGFLTIVGPLAGVYYIDQSAATNPTRNYTSFTDAVTALNNLGIGSFVTFEVAPGQTFLEGGALVPIITATGTAANPVKFERDPSTAIYAASLANPVLQPTGGTGNYDAALTVAGGDYFTFSNLTIGQPAASTALEFGVAFFRALASNGAQNNTVQNCTINLNAATAGTAGIYSAPTTAFAPTTALTLTAGGQNSNNTLVGNTISNVATGINWLGYNDATLYDANNSFGGAASATTGNAISSYGVAGTVAYGIFVNYQGQALLNNNSVTGTSNGAAMYGVYQAASSVATDVAMSYNTVSLTETVTGTTSYALYGVQNLAAGAASNTATLSNNKVTLTVTENTTTDQSAFVRYGVYNAAASGSVAMSGNQVLGTATNQNSGSNNVPQYGVYNTGNALAAAGSLVLSNNIVNLPFVANGGGGGNGSNLTYAVYNTGTAAGTADLSGNNVQYAATFTANAGFGGSFYGVYNNAAVTGALTMNNNTATDSYTNTAGNTSTNAFNGIFYGVYNSSTVGGTANLNGNTVTSTPSTSTSTNASSSYSRTTYAVYNTNTIAGGLTMSSNVASQAATVNGAGAISSATFNGVYNSGSVGSAGLLAMNSNTVTTTPKLLSTGIHSSNFYGVYNSGTINNTGTTAATLTGNTVNATSTVSGTGTMSGTFYGVYNSGTNSGSLTLTNNNVLTNAGASYLTTGALNLLYNTSGPSGTQTLTGNTVGPAATPGAANLITTSTSYLFYNNSAPTGATTFSNNVFRNLTNSGSGSVVGYFNSANATSDFTANQNSFSNLSLTNAAAGFYGIFLGTSNGQKETLTNNTFTTIATGTANGVTGASNESDAIFLYNGAATSVVSGNTVTNFSSNGMGTLTGIRLGSNSYGGSVFQNTLSGLSSSAGSVVGIVNNTSTSGTTTNIYRNQLTNLSGTAAGSTVTGISVTSGVTMTVHTNQVSNLTAPAATSTTAVVGLSVSGGTTTNAYYNSVYLAGNNAGTTAGTYGFYRSGTPTVSLRNNILYNESTGGAANYAIGTASTSGFAGSMANPSTNSSDYNLFFVANAAQMGNFGGTAYAFANWKTATNGDGSSMSETSAVVPSAGLFANTATGDLSLQAANPVAWYANGTGTQVASIATDYSGTTPRPTTVAAGAPDIGSTEVTPTSTPPAMTATPAAPALGGAQTFTLGGRTLAVLTYGSTTMRQLAGALPSLVVGRYFSGSNPPTPFLPNARYANAYFTFTDANGDGSGFTYQPALTYDPASLGTIASEMAQQVSQRRADNSGYDDYPSLVSPAPVRVVTGPNTLARLGLLAFSDVAAPLPVSLTRFEAVRQEQNAALSWTTASETDNAGFEVQVSVDGQSFRKLGFVAAASPSSLSARSYAFLDRESGKAGLRYYRLQQLDLSGKSSYSPVRTLDFGRVTTTSLTASPNPFTSQLTLTMLTQTATDGGLLTLLDASGRAVLTQQLTVAAGASTLTLDNLDKLPAGVYILRLTLDGQQQYVKVLKQ